MKEKMIIIRKQHKESQSDLSKAIGYNRVQIARYETGENEPPVRYIRDFCNHYKCDANWLLDIVMEVEAPEKSVDK